MPSIIKSPSELTQEEIDRLFTIYKFSFQKNRLPTRPFSEWKQELDSTYCYTGTGRRIQVFSVDGVVRGYTVSAGEEIGKIMQGGALHSDQQTRSAFFTAMLGELRAALPGTELIAEIKYGSAGIQQSFETADFKQMNESSRLRTITRRLLGDLPIEFVEGPEGLLIRRNAKLDEDYLARWMHAPPTSAPS